ncbi:MAG: hypothetical protein K0S07_1687, partial [Chlamydiales bacterium]|nr:hypothetical protein [Chlamydiales bacterium]
MNLRLLNLKFFLLLLTFLNFSPLLAEEEVEEYLEEEALEYLQENALIEDESLQAKAVPECVKNPVPYMQSLNPMNVLEGCFDVLSGSPFYRDEGLVVGNGQNALTWQGFISDLQGVHRISAKNYHALSWRTRKKDCEAFITDLYLGQVKRGGYDIHDATPENQYQRMYFSSKVENKYKKDSQFKIDYKTHGYLKSDQYSNSYNTNFDNISARNNLKNMKLSLWWPEPKSESLLSLSQPLNYVEGHFELTEGD